MLAYAVVGCYLLHQKNEKLFARVTQLELDYAALAKGYINTSRVKLEEREDFVDNHSDDSAENAVAETPKQPEPTVEQKSRLTKAQEQLNKHTGDNSPMSIVDSVAADQREFGEAYYEVHGKPPPEWS